MQLRTMLVLLAVYLLCAKPCTQARVGSTSLPLFVWMLQEPPTHPSLAASPYTIADPAPTESLSIQDESAHPPAMPRVAGMHPPTSPYPLGTRGDGSLNLGPRFARGARIATAFDRDPLYVHTGPSPSCGGDGATDSYSPSTHTSSYPRLRRRCWLAKDPLTPFPPFSPRGGTDFNQYGQIVDGLAEVGLATYVM